MDQSDLERYRRNFIGEVDSAHLYHALARLVQQKDQARLYERLARVEEAHASYWARQLEKSGAPLPPRRPSFRTRLLVALARCLGPRIVLPIAVRLEAGDSGTYDSQPEARATRMAAQERAHARLLDALAGTKVDGRNIARLEGRHRTATSGNALRAAVLGANDGLLSNLSLVMGVAGAAMNSRAVLVTGLAGMVAGSCSMALGEWLSVQSSREFNSHQIEVEADELTHFPAEEKEELVLIYESKGLSESEARALVARLFENEQTALNTLAREELGIDPDGLGGSPLSAAAISFLLFAAGAIIPVAPFFGLSGNSAITSSLVIAGMAMFLMGTLVSLFTGRSALYSGVRQVTVGLIAAGITYGIGRVLGVTLGG